MALPTSGALSLNAIHVEAGGASGTQASLNDADIRGLIGKGSGAQMSFNEWYGASASSPYADITVGTYQDPQKYGGNYRGYSNGAYTPNGSTLGTAHDNTIEVNGTSYTISFLGTATGIVNFAYLVLVGNLTGVNLAANARLFMNNLHIGTGAAGGGAAFGYNATSNVSTVLLTYVAQPTVGTRYPNCRIV